MMPVVPSRSSGSTTRAVSARPTVSVASSRSAPGFAGGAARTTLLAKGAGAMNGAQYLASLQDDGEVWLGGERVRDVTTHPAFARVCRSLADTYDQQCAPDTRDAMTYALPDGRRVSYSYLLPTSREELLLRRRNTEYWAEATFGMIGRFPD